MKFKCSELLIFVNNYACLKVLDCGATCCVNVEDSSHLATAIIAGV